MTYGPRISYIAHAIDSEQIIFFVGAKVQLIKAEYAAGKFTGGKADKALSNLCDPEADNGDCDYMDELQPLLDADPSLVDGEIVKHENDATTAPELLALIDSVSARTPDGGACVHPGAGHSPSCPR